jgi:hypothetical protein
LLSINGLFSRRSSFYRLILWPCNTQKLLQGLGKMAGMVAASVRGKFGSVNSPFGHDSKA